jgi:hypothetical protein
MANISQRSHPSINHYLFDWGMISLTISIGMQLVHRHKMEAIVPSIFWIQHSCLAMFLIFSFPIWAAFIAFVRHYTLANSRHLAWFFIPWIAVLILAALDPGYSNLPLF